MLTFLHAADLHLDSPFDALPPEKAARRRQELRELPGRLASLAAERQVDVVLLSGDLLDGGQTFYETTLALARALGQISAPVFIAPGNHDFYSARSPYASVAWPANVHIFTSGRMERVALPRLGCAVYGAAFTAPACETSLLEGFQPQADQGLIRLMALHGEVARQSRYNPITPEQLAASGMDYVALGHLHTFGGLCRAGKTCYAWPGCPEGRGFDEPGARGVLLGAVDESGCRAEFLPLCRRRYEILEVALHAGDDPAAALAAALPENRREDIFRIVLTGESDLGGVDLKALTPLLEGRFFHASLRDRTAVRRELWERSGEDSLTGLFLREMARRIQAADPADRPRLERAVRFGLAALEGGEDLS